MDASLDKLWNSAPASSGTFSWQHTARLPEPARRLLEHAVTPGTLLASAVRLRMHGEIKLGRWLPFRAEQIVRRDGEFMWAATMNPLGVPLFRGFDRLVDGAGQMQWKLFGLIPMIAASGADITRAAAGRVQTESVWLPSLLCRHDVTWSSADSSHVTATIAVAGVTSPVDFTIDERGRLLRVRVSRWSNPPGDTKGFRMVDFGGFVDQERTFGGYTIPTHVRAGWFIGSPEFETNGEFFRATIEDAVFR